jgi:hypothetical protein
MVRDQNFPVRNRLIASINLVTDRARQSMHDKESGDVANPRIAGPVDLRGAIESLTEAERFKLNRYADNRIAHLGIYAGCNTGKDLLQEALSALWEQRRRWQPDRVDLVGQLIGSMRSIADGWKRKGEAGKTEIAERHLRRLNEDGEETDTPISSAPTVQPNPEERLLLQETITQEEFLADMDELFADDLNAQLVFDGWRAGMRGPEIISKIDEFTPRIFDTTVKRISRRVEKRWPKGMPNVL